MSKESSGYNFFTVLIVLMICVWKQVLGGLLGILGLLLLLLLFSGAPLDGQLVDEGGVHVGREVSVIGTV